VDGVLAISRALGDHTFKNNTNVQPDKQRVSAVPDVYTVDNVGADDMILLICDGIYEGSSNEAAVNAFKGFLDENPDDPAVALSMLFDKQLGGSQDNMSSILIQFKDGSQYSSLSSQGEQEYVPCELIEGREFSKAFLKFGQRYGHANGRLPKAKGAKGKKGKAKKEAKKATNSAIDTSEKNNTTTTSSSSVKKGKKRKGVEKVKEEKKEEKEDDTDTDTTDEEQEETLEQITPRRSSRILTQTTSTVFSTSTTTSERKLKKKK